MRILFVRHAQASHNADALIRGVQAYLDPVNTDAGLTGIGRDQVSTGRLDFHWKPDLIYCSPLLRCRQTLLGLYPAAAKMPVDLDDRLMEPQGSAFCNKRADRELIQKSVPPTWNLDGVNKINPFSQLEEEHMSIVFHQRIRSFWTYLRTLHGSSDSTILIVSHHDWIQGWFRLFKGKEVSPTNCEVLVVDA